MFDQLGVGIVPSISWGIVDGAPALHAVDDLLADSADGLTAGAVVHCQKEDDHAAGGEAAEVAEALQEQDVRAVASGGDSGGEPGGAAADHEDVGGGGNGDSGLRKLDGLRLGRGADAALAAWAHARITRRCAIGPYLRGSCVTPARAGGCLLRQRRRN